MPSHIRLFGLPLLVLACLGCQLTALNMPTPTASSSPAPAYAAARLDGVVTLPVITAGSGNIISTGGGSVITAGGGNVITAGAGNVISAGGGNVITAGGGNVIPSGNGSYRLQDEPPAAEDELPVFGAIAFLRDPVTRKLVTGVAPAFTDEHGRFSFANVPAGLNFIVEVDVVTRDNQRFRLMTLAHPQDGASANVSWRSTACTSALVLDKPNPGLYVADWPQWNDMEQNLKTTLMAMPEQERVQRLHQVIGLMGDIAPASASGATPMMSTEQAAAMRDRLRAAGAQVNETNTMVVPDVLAPTAIEDCRAVLREAVAKNAALAGLVSTVEQQATTTPSTEQAGQIAVVGQLVSPTSSPSPSPSASASTATTGATSTSLTSGTTTSSSGASTSTSTTTSSSTSGTTSGTVDSTVTQTTSTTSQVTGTVEQTVSTTTQTVSSPSTSTTSSTTTSAPASGTSSTTSGATSTSGTTTTVSNTTSSTVGTTSGTVSGATGTVSTTTSGTISATGL